MSPQTYTVQITMTPATVQALAASNYALIALLGVQTSDAAALPLVWLRTQQYSMNTLVTYTAQFGAFTSQSALAPGSKVVPAFSTPIEEGQLLAIEQTSGFGSVTVDGTPGAIAIQNATSTPFTAGICELGTALTPVCGVPLYGNGYDLVTPLPTIFLEFTTLPTTAGTAMAVSTGPGVLIDQSSAPQCAVTYDINAGWSAGDQPRVQPLPARTALAPLLAGCSTSLSRRAREIDVVPARG